MLPGLLLGNLVLRDCGYADGASAVQISKELNQLLSLIFTLALQYTLYNVPEALCIMYIWQMWLVYQVKLNHRGSSGMLYLVLPMMTYVKLHRE